MEALVYRLSKTEQVKQNNSWHIMSMQSVFASKTLHILCDIFGILSFSFLRSFSINIEVI